MTDAKNDLEYVIKEGYNILDKLSNQIKEAIETMSATENSQFDYQAIWD